MKKLMLAALLASISTLAVANPYVQGEFGYSKMEAKNTAKLKDSKAIGRVAVGKDLGNMRYQVDYTHFGKIKDDSALAAGFNRADLKAQSIGVSAIYDFATASEFTPYAGVRVGLNRLDLHVESATSKYSNDSTKVGVGALAGIEYKVSPQVALNVGAEYNHLGKIDYANTKVNQYGATVGARYNF